MDCYSLTNQLLYAYRARELPLYHRPNSYCITDVWIQIIFSHPHPANHITRQILGKQYPQSTKLYNVQTKT